MDCSHVAAASDVIYAIIAGVEEIGLGKEVSAEVQISTDERGYVMIRDRAWDVKIAPIDVLLAVVALNEETVLVAEVGLNDF